MSLIFLAGIFGIFLWAQAAGLSIEAARTRSFFGIYSVKADTGRMIRMLEHGTTLHGVQSLLPDLATTPMSYYGPGSGIAEAMQALPAMSGRFANVGIVGLGAGSLACFGQAGQGWTAFEIDPAVVEIAKDTRLFTYLDRCAPDLADQPQPSSYTAPDVHRPRRSPTVRATCTSSHEAMPLQSATAWTACCSRS
ncbi:MAG: hypothetical protein HC871_14220 [Rhizobiales bacterium]|nr:hypothetical protein [Hyphomicrobiales bacterium]